MHAIRQVVARASWRGAARGSLVRRAGALALRPWRLRAAGALALALLLGACTDYTTGPGRYHDRLVGTWYRTDQVHDAWYGHVRMETTWEFRRDGRVYYSEVLKDFSGHWLDEVTAYGRWYTDRHRDRVTIDYYDPASWGRETLRYDVTGRSLYLDGLRYERW